MMMRDFIIYGKNGVAKHESKTAYNNDGEQVQTDSLEYHGSWMGECYITVDVHSAYPIDFQIGDYIDYRGERFTLINDPAVVKKAARGSYGEGFEYNDIKFSARQAELTDIRFLDYVLSDNELHYTSLPDFPFYAASIEDYADRLQANTNRWCQENGFILSGYDSVAHGYTQTDYWLFITPDRDRFIQRAAILRKDGDTWVGLTPAAAGAIWDASYPNGTNVSDEKKDIAVTVSSEAISTALERIKKDFGLNFINRDRKVIIGAAGIETDHLFEYGKGHGLYEMERQVDSDQQVITKLYAYGSDKNMPVRFYSDVQREYYDYVRGYTVKDISHGYRKYVDMEMDMLFDSDLFTMELKENWEFGRETLIHYEVEIRVNDITVKAYAFRVGDVDSYKLHLYTMAYGDGRWESLTDPETFESFVDALNKGDKVYFTKHINGKEWPEKKHDYSNVDLTAYTSFVELVDAQHYTGEYINLEFIIDTQFDKKYFTTKSDDVNVYDGEGKPVDGYIISMHYDDCKATCLVWKELEGTHAGKCHVRMRWEGDNSKERDYYEHGWAKAKAFFDNRHLLQDSELIIDGGVNYTYFPTIHSEYIEPALPNNMAVNKLMLPGFPTQSLYAWVKSQPDCTAHDDATGQATWRGYTAIFSKEKYRPFILSLNSSELGIREASKNFDGSEDTDEIFPTLEKTGYDVIQKAEVISDNGIFEDGDDTPTVNLTVPLFDGLDELVGEKTESGEEASIQIKDGYCGGRTLKIKNVVRKDNMWEIKCEREYDDLIQLYFPYSYNVSIGEKPVANEAYQIRGANIDGYDGDHFVYTGIQMTKTYVDAASVKLLEKALEFLSKNDYTRYTYLPKVDDLFMAREHDDAVLNSRTSLHDSIKEGDLLNFKDADLQIDDSLVFIDSLTIKENGNNGIPTYEVTLRTEKTVGTMQRMQNQINAIATQGGNGLSKSQIDREVESVGKTMFLSKETDDVAKGVIGFAKGFWVKALGMFGIDSDGNAKVNDLESAGDTKVGGNAQIDGEATVNGGLDVNGTSRIDNIQSHNYTGDGLADTGWKITNSDNGHSKLTIDEIYVRMKAVFESLEVRERTYTGGDQIWSCAGNQIVRTDYLGNTETADHVPVMIPVHADGSPSSAGAANTYMVPQPGDTYGYSQVKVPWLLKGAALVLGRNNGLIRGLFSHYSKVRIVISDEEVTSNRGANRAAAVSDISKIRRARCYFLAKDGEREIHNWWRINDLARCQTMNIDNVTRQTYISGEDTKQGNIFWWRKVIGVSYEPVQLDDGKWYHYFDVAFDYDLEATSPETMATSVMEGSDIPAAGDAVVQFGNTIIEGRMNLMMMEVNGGDAVGYSASADAPCLKAYRGVYSFDLTKCWIGGQCCKMKLSPKSGYEFYGPHFKQVTEYDVVPVPVERGLWNDITPTRDDYREHANVRKCYYYDKVSHNGSYWLCSIVDGSHWVNASGNYISDADYAALSDDAKAQCARKQNYTIDEPSEESSDWTLVVEKGTSIRSMVTQYAKQTTAQYTGTPPTSGWEDTIADLGTINDGDYLWIKTTISYSDTLNDSTVYSVSRWGIDGDGIANIETKFYEDDDLLSQSDLAALSENSWKDAYSQLALNQGDYIYTRTKITYDQGGTPTVSYSINRLGEDGVSYVTTEEYYCLGSSNTTPPTGCPYTRNDGKPQTIPASSLVIGGDWSESRPTYDPSTAAGRAKKYLWNFEVSYDTTTNVQVTQPLCIANYEKGIQSIVETYTVSTHPTKADMLADTAERTAHPWVDEVQNSAPTDAFPYQWNKAVTTYTDNSTDTFYHISAVKGTRGSNGDTPISVFAWNQSPDTAPAISGNAYPPTGWNVTAPSRPSTSGDHYLWMSQSVKHANDTIDNWGTPVRISGDKGDAGEDASDQEFVYIRLDTYPFPNNVTKPADATRGKIHGTGDWVPAADQYGVDDWVPEGWSDTALPVAEDNQYVYAAIRTKAAGHDEDWDGFDEPFLWGNWGHQGIDGDGVQYIYKLFDHELNATERENNVPTNATQNADGEWLPTPTDPAGVNNGWSDDPQSPTVSQQYCYCSIIKKINGEWNTNGNYGAFETLGLWSRFSKDGQSAYKSTMFVRLNTTPTKPANNKGSYNNPSPSDCPAGTSGGSTIYWSDGIPSGEAQIWATSRIFTNDGTSPQQSSWSTPQPMSDTDTFDVEFAVMQTNDAIPATPTANNRHKDAYPYGYEGQVWFDPDLDKYSAEGVLRDFTQMYWRAERECKNGDWGDWTIQRIKGEKGDPGTNGDTPIQLFKWSQTPLTAADKPAVDETDWATQDPYSGWYKQAQNRPSGDGYILYMSQNTLTGAGTIDSTAWNTPIQISGTDGTPGEDGKEREWIYRLDTNTGYASTTGTIGGDSTKPVSGQTGGIDNCRLVDDFVPTNWSDNPLGVSKNHPTEYASFRIYDHENDRWGAFQMPIIWSHWGRNGMDGDGTEYVFIRTKEFVEPIIDDEGSSYLADEWKPLISNGAACDAEKHNNEYRTTDDPTGTDDTYKYEWVAKRTMSAADATTGQRTWKSYRECIGSPYKMSLWSNYAESNLIIDLDNQEDQFGTDSENEVIGNQVRSTGVSLYYGTQEQAIVGTNPLTAQLFYASDDGETTPISDTSIAEVSCVVDSQDNTKGTVTVTIKDGAVITDTGLFAKVTAKCARDNNGKTAYFNLGKVKSGAQGVSPTIYQLALSQKSLSYGYDSNGDLIAKNNSVTVSVKESTGSSSQIKTLAQSGKTCTWGYDGTYNTYTVNPANPVITVAASDVGNHTKISIQLSTGDKEELPIVKDGETGPQGPSGTSVIIKGEVTYKNHVDVLGHTRPVNPTIANLGEIDLLNYSDTSEDMIDVCEEIGTDLYGWEAYSIEVGTCYKFNKHLYEATETGWLDLGQFEGDNGKDGKDGWMITADPANVIITQNMVTTSNFTSATVSFSAKKGSVDATISSIGTPSSSTFNVAKGTGSNNKKVIVSSPKTYIPTGETESVYYSEGVFTVTVNVIDPDTGNSVAFNDVTVPCYANLMGKFKREIEGDVETSVATKLTHAIDGGTGVVTTFDQVGTYIRSATENIQKLSKAIVSRNIMPMTGWTDITGDPYPEIGSEHFDPYTQELEAEEPFSRAVALEAGKDYCFSIYTDNNTVPCLYLLDENGSPGSEVYFDEMTDILSGDTIKIGNITYYRHYIVFDISDEGLSSGNYLIGPYVDASVNLFYRPQLEIGSTPTDYGIPTIRYDSEIHQNAEQIDMSVSKNEIEQAGIHINGSNSTIDLVAGRVNFKMPGGGTNPKISINPSTGALNAVDGHFSGTVRATNFYQNLCIFYEGSVTQREQYSSYKHYCFNGFEWDGVTYVTGNYYDSAPADDYDLHFCMCTYDSELINLVSLYGQDWGSSHKTCYLPDPKDFEGKLIHAYVPKIVENPSGSPYIDCVKRLVDPNERLFAKRIYMSGGKVYAESASVEVYDVVAPGSEAVYQAIYADGDEKYYWLKLL